MLSILSHIQPQIKKKFQKFSRILLCLSSTLKLGISWLINFAMLKLFISHERLKPKELAQHQERCDKNQRERASQLLQLERKSVFTRGPCILCRLCRVGPARSSGYKVEFMSGLPDEQRSSKLFLEGRMMKIKQTQGTNAKRNTEQAIYLWGDKKIIWIKDLGGGGGCSSYHWPRVSLEVKFSLRCLPEIVLERAQKNCRERTRLNEIIYFLV